MTRPVIAAALAPELSGFGGGGSFVGAIFGVSIDPNTESGAFSIICIKPKSRDCFP